MESIKKYIERFTKRNQYNHRYCMYFREVILCSEAFKKKPMETISTIFAYGYAKGYRAAMAEMKKKGGAA